MELDNVVEEDSVDGDRGVQVAQWNEVHGQNHGLATYSRESLDEVDDDVGLHRTRQLEGLQ
jgi:hypothetical protein